MRSLGKALLIGSIWVLSLTPTYTTIDVVDGDKGMVHVSYKSTSNTPFKVMIKKGEVFYTYNLKADGTSQTFPLQLGNGEYTIRIMENKAGNQYQWIEQKQIHLQLQDTNLVYLNSIEEIKWDETMQAIKKAQTLVGEEMMTKEKITTLYQYITEYYKYNEDKLVTLSTNYLPIIDKMFQEKQGICYDFAALYAAMLRSQGIPTKLVKGYTPYVQGYHAWNEVYDEESGEWWIIDISHDVQVLEAGKTAQMIKSDKDYQKVGEY